MQIDSSAPDLGAIVKDHFPDLKYYEEIYKDIHSHPELGKTEKRTSKLIAEHLTELGFSVTTNIGGYGVVGVLHHGQGKKVLLRADIDGLPVLEETGVPYASKARGVNRDGEDVPLMHACGHDFHITSLLAASKLLYNARHLWSGTLIALFQPDEEGGTGAQSMVYDGLYDKIPVPDVCLGQHVYPGRAGDVAACNGTFMAAADSYKVTIYGRGGHGSQPQNCIDPVLIASYVVVRLQSIVSRMISPTETAVVTVGSIHGGRAENVIADEVEIKVNVRTFSKEARQTVLSGIEGIIRAECESAGSPKEPKFEAISRFPATSNDEETMKLLQGVFEGYFGEDRLSKLGPKTWSEDFSNLARANDIPYAFWYFGGTDHETWDKVGGDINKLSGNHSSKFAPVIQPTLKTGVEALSLAALKYLTIHD